MALPVVHQEYFFWTGRGKIETVLKNIRNTFVIIGRKTGIHVHPHRFRDTFATRLLQNRHTLEQVQQLLGHKSIRTTEKHYKHFVPEMQEALDEATASLDFVSPRSLPKKPLQYRIGNA